MSAPPFPRPSGDPRRDEDVVRAGIARARRDLWWFIERDTGEGWGFTDSDTEVIAERAMSIQDAVLAPLLPALDRLTARLQTLERELEREKRAHDAESDMLAADRNAERRRAHTIEQAFERLGHTLAWVKTAHRIPDGQLAETWLPAVLAVITTDLEAALRSPCGECGQVDGGQTGEYPCPSCGLPRTWDARAVVLEGRPQDKDSGGLQSRPCESSGGES